MYIDFSLKESRPFFSFEDEDITAFVRLVQNALSAKRFRHCIAVGQMLGEMDHNIDANASIALGLAHDFSKELPDSLTFEIIRKNRLALYDGEKINPQTLHAVTSAYFFRLLFPSAPLDFSFSIRHHTILSHEYVSDLCLNLYVADKVDVTRSYVSNSFREELIACQSAKLRALMTLERQRKRLQMEGKDLFACTLKLYSNLRREL